MGIQHPTDCLQKLISLLGLKNRKSTNQIKACMFKS
uniref:Uncharacterized protein n=1 Tax=Rhizophora mucronata TaxID=61149 RepID=A0A2P2P7F9_RHIMU